MLNKKTMISLEDKMNQFIEVLKKRDEYYVRHHEGAKPIIPMADEAINASNRRAAFDAHNALVDRVKESLDKLADKLPDKVSEMTPRQAGYFFAILDMIASPFFEHIDEIAEEEIVIKEHGEHDKCEVCTGIGLEIALDIVRNKTTKRGVELGILRRMNE